MFEQQKINFPENSRNRDTLNWHDKIHRLPFNLVSFNRPCGEIQDFKGLTIFSDLLRTSCDFQLLLTVKSKGFILDTCLASPILRYIRFNAYIGWTADVSYNNIVFVLSFSYPHLYPVSCPLFCNSYSYMHPLVLTYMHSLVLTGLIFPIFQCMHNTP